MLYLSVGDLLLMITVHNCLEVHSPSFLMGAPMGRWEAPGRLPCGENGEECEVHRRKVASTMVSVKVS